MTGCVCDFDFLAFLYPLLEQIFHIYIIILFRVLLLANTFRDDVMRYVKLRDRSRLLMGRSVRAHNACTAPKRQNNDTSFFPVASLSPPPPPHKNLIPTNKRTIQIIIYHILLYQIHHIQYKNDFDHES